MRNVGDLIFLKNCKNFVKPAQNGLDELCGISNSKDIDQPLFHPKSSIFK